MINALHFQGRLVADAELKRTSGDVSYTEFTIAWSEKYKETETRCFLRCKAWRNTAEFINKYFHKGTMIAIDGHMITEQWQTNGENKSRTVCVIDKAHFCGGKNEGGEEKPKNTPAVDSDGFMSIPDGINEELPFA